MSAAGSRMIILSVSVKSGECIGGEYLVCVPFDRLLVYVWPLLILIIRFILTIVYLPFIWIVKCHTLCIMAHIVVLVHFITAIPSNKQRTAQKKIGTDFDCHPIYWLTIALINRKLEWSAPNHLSPTLSPSKLLFITSKQTQSQPRRF